jgi:hypothetical protein
MDKELPDELPAQIEYHIVVALLGPIISDIYPVGKSKIQVSYPSVIIIPQLNPIPLPNGLSTMFQVRWEDPTGEIIAQLRSKGFERFAPLYYALDQINELLLAYKLVRIGHMNGSEVRTVGEADCLFYVSFINGHQTDNLNMRLRTHGGTNRWGAAHPIHSEDPLGTTELALPHIGQPTFPIGRKFARCFDLIEHGYYTEALIVSFAILDDQVQFVLNSLLQTKGLVEESERKRLLRNIKEQRLKLFLGPVLKLLLSKSISELWPDADEALEWLNKERNNAMHGGYQAKRSSAALALFASMKLLLVLSRNGAFKLELPNGMYREARILAAWQDSPPKWVPRSNEIENIND